MRKDVRATWTTALSAMAQRAAMLPVAQVMKSLPSDATLLWIGEGDSTVLAVRSDLPVAGWRLALGSQRIAGQTWRSSPPSPLELEQSIADVEDVLAPLARALPAAQTLMVLTDQSAGFARFRIDSQDESTILPVEQIEHLFRALAALSEGHPQPVDECLRHSAFATVLLITREFMHHLNYREVRFGWDAALASADSGGASA